MPMLTTLCAHGAIADQSGGRVIRIISRVRARALKMNRSRYRISMCCCFACLMRSPFIYAFVCKTCAPRACCASDLLCLRLPLVRSHNFRNSRDARARCTYTHTHTQAQSSHCVYLARRAIAPAFRPRVDRTRIIICISNGVCTRAVCSM